MLTTVTDVWHTLRPPEGDKHGPLAPLLLMLTVVTGLVDAFSYLVLGHVFVANMTGNVVFLAFALVGATGFSLSASLLALVAFALGAMAAAVNTASPAVVRASIRPRRAELMWRISRALDTTPTRKAPNAVREAASENPGAWARAKPTKTTLPVMLATNT